MSPVAGRRSVATWLFVCAGFVLAMVVVGGITRLTRSGLSIVDWKPITGVLPPLSHEAWLAELARYQASPEGRLVNHAMDLAGFQQIFLVEWAHRLLGRLTGVVVLVPFVWFLVSGALRGGRALRVAGIFLLGGLQGFVGWFMVKSGLVDVPQVSHLRLALHLDLALLIFALLLWAAFDEVYGARAASLAPSPRGGLARPFALTTMLLAALTLTWGAFMAGLHAGHLAPTFPLMNGEVIPSGLGLSSPMDLADNPLVVHFTHRTLAYCMAAGALLTAWVTLSSAAAPRARNAARFLVGILLLQVALGAWVVLSHVNIVAASLHQLNGALVLAGCVALLHGVRR